MAIKKIQTMEKHVTYKSPILISQIEKEKNPFTFSCINYCVYFGKKD